MRNKAFRISSGLKLAMLAMLFMTLHACQTVYTPNPLPSAASPQATAFPKLMAGDYLIVEEKGNGSDREPGQQYVKITLSDEQHCLVETYFGFSLEDLAAHPHRERFEIREGYLIYKNDSLIQELAEAKARAEASPENQEYQRALKSLKNLEENGYLNHITPVSKRGNLMTYNREPVLGIDLVKNEATAYEDPNLIETRPLNIKLRNGRLFLSNSDSKHGWENLIVELSNEGIKGFDISFKHVLKNKVKYEKTANFNQPGDNAIIIDPSVSELDKMLDEEGFLSEQVTLKRVVLEEEARTEPSWLLIALGAIVLVVLLRVMRRPQVQV